MKGKQKADIALFAMCQGRTLISVLWGDVLARKMSNYMVLRNSIIFNKNLYFEHINDNKSH